MVSSPLTHFEKRELLVRLLRFSRGAEGPPPMGPIPILVVSQKNDKYKTITTALLKMILAVIVVVSTMILCFIAGIPRCTANSIVGRLPMLFRNRGRLHDYTVDLLKESGGTIEFKSPKWLPLSDYFLTCDPSNIQHILSTNFANYPKGDEFRHVFDALGDGILNVDGDLWRLQRKMFQTWTVRQKKFDFVSKIIYRKVVCDLIPFLEHVSETGIQVDLQEVLEEMITFNNAMSLNFGYDIASSTKFRLPKGEYQKAFAAIQQTLFRRHIIPQGVWKIQRWLGVGGEGEYKRAMEVFSEFMRDCIALKRKEIGESGKRRPGNDERDKEEWPKNLDMMAIYMEEKENPFPDKFLMDVALNLTGASRDTLTATLTWFFWLITTHPCVEAKILEELREILHPSDEFVRAEELDKLVYLQAALCETLRLYPSVPFNHKTAVEPDVLPSGHCIGANQMILISFYATGRMEELWGKDFSEFKPERWITMDADRRKQLIYMSPNKFPVFNVGQRTCLGREMAFIQTKVVAINVLKAYQLRVVEGHPIVPRMSITLHMKHGLKITVAKRCN